MSIIGISGWQDTGKTVLGRIICDEIISKGKTYTVAANLHLKELSIPDKYFTSKELIGFMERSITTQRKNCLFFFDEADRALQNRFWKDEDRTMALTGLWQDEKMDNDFLYTYHASGSVDKILRLATGIEIKVLDIDRRLWNLLIRIENWRTGKAWTTVVRGIDKYFDKYDRWEVIV